MKNKRIILLAVSALLAASCQNQGQQQTPPPPELPVIEVATRDITTNSEYPTQLQGIISSDIRAKVSGYILNVLVEEGSAVKKGETLFELETESLSGEASAARAQVNAAQIEVEKLRPLVEKNIVSENQLQTAKARLETAKSNLNSISASVGYATIKSPVDGYIGSINYRDGALINPADRLPLTRVVKTDKVFAYFSVNEKDYLNMLMKFNQNSKGESSLISSFPEVVLILPNGQVYDKKGKITSISSQVNPETGTLRFRATFENANLILKDGLTGKIRIPNYIQDAVLVPRVSTFSRQGKEFVFLFNASDSTVTEKAVETRRADPYLVIGSGLQKGEKIVGSGVNKVKNNDKINPVSSTMDSIVNSFDTVFK
ncbi:efflux RND transporter periplasmic adaptor subunit [Psychroflexus sp. YR1-1]|uniref:Efflux RND transporter periplasmic adaptor subunit n=1 Tax=Psychroflexus aurantiacus TaxID=2709310 RepID=A0A6B3R021_9FLAO|nr:efflux RND transporter periplasmic adaptor subunit [Psychroflexus aurantiacus]NEV93482.1 efflux RND transporter periplasmic adaptor subunit [Psychroflexus aurantiacus]